MRNKISLATAFLTIALMFTPRAESNPSESTHSATTLSVAEAVVPAESFEVESESTVDQLYKEFTLNNASMPSLISFTKGITGYNKLKEEGKIKNEILTIVDFSLPSTEKRMWILDMTDQKVLFHTVVAHGKNTGIDMATEFSNTENSFQSSLGFYVTAETYYGKNGLSLFIDGQEEGFNSNARQRYVVVHGADYANPEFIAQNGRLGRSLGCPAVPTAIAKEVIHTIKGNSVLFIYHTNEDYAKKSKYLNPATV